MKENNSLKSRTLSSLFSSYFVSLANKASYTLVHIILARILFPKDFGLFALAFMLLNIAKVIIQLGLSDFIIREEKINYSALFILELIAGLFVFISLQVITPYLGKYNSALPNVNRVLSFAVIPYCLSIVPVTYAHKELRLKEMVIPNLLFFPIFGVAAILLSLNKLGVWSLIYAHIISEVAMVYLIWRAMGRFIRLDFRFKAKELFGLIYGAKWFFALALFGIFTGSIDKIVLGKLVTLKDLGYYTVAFAFSMHFVDIIEPALNNVLYPLFSKIKNDITKTKELYSSATFVLYWLEVPLYLFLSFNADIIVKIILGPRWLPAVGLFRLLCILPIINPCATFGYQILLAHKKENVQLCWSLTYFFMFVAVGWYCVKHIGVVGIIYAQFFIYPMVFIFLYFVNKITENVASIFV